MVPRRNLSQADRLGGGADGFLHWLLRLDYTAHTPPEWMQEIDSIKIETEIERKEKQDDPGVDGVEEHLPHHRHQLDRTNNHYLAFPNI